MGVGGTVDTLQTENPLGHALGSDSCEVAQSDSKLAQCVLDVHLERKGKPPLEGKQRDAVRWIQLFIPADQLIENVP